MGFVCSDDAQDPLPMQLLQKYIAYARQYCHPVLSDDAKQILKEHYCKLRQDTVPNEGAPVTVSSAHPRDVCIPSLCCPFWQTRLSLHQPT